MRMKVLFLLFNYSPFGGAAARIISGLSKEFYAQGIESDVLTTKYELNQPFKAKESFQTVYRVENCKVFNLKKISCNFFKKGLISLKKLKDKISFKNSKRFYSRCTVNDFFKGLKKVDLTKYDYIIPVCAEYALYAAIEKYRTRKGLNNKVIVYQLDPLSNNSAYSPKSFSDRLQMEKRMATENTLVTTKILKAQKELNGVDRSNVVTLEFPSISQPVNITKEFSDEIKVVFSGFFYSDMRNPEYALKLFLKIRNPKVKLYIVGGGLEDLTSQYAEESEGRIIPLGVLPLEQAEQKILEADFLLNIGNKDINFVPSKIFDYISTGKPIINTFKNSACPTLKYFAKYDNVLCIDESAPIENELIRLEEFIKTNYNKVLSYEEIKKNFEENTVEFVARRFIEIIKKR